MARYFKAKNKRECFRINYPMDERPVLLYGEKSYKIINLSERGIKLILHKDQNFTVQKKISSKLMIGEEHGYLVKGKIIIPSGAKLIYRFKLNSGEKQQLLLAQKNEKNIAFDIAGIIRSDFDLENCELHFPKNQDFLIKSLPDIDAFIEFKNGSQRIFISGKIIRTTLKNIILHLDIGISSKKIADQQRYLIRSGKIR